MLFEITAPARMPDLKAIYMANESVPACAEALADEKTSRRVLVVGNDLTDATRRLLLEGTVDFIIEQNIYWQGYQPIVTLKKLIEMPSYPVQEIPLPISVSSIQRVSAGRKQHNL